MKIDPHPTNLGEVDEIAFHANSLREAYGLLFMFLLESRKLRSFFKEVYLSSTEV